MTYNTIVDRVNEFCRTSLPSYAVLPLETHAGLKIFNGMWPHGASSYAAFDRAFEANDLTTIRTLIEKPQSLYRQCQACHSLYLDMK